MKSLILVVWFSVSAALIGGCTEVAKVMTANQAQKTEAMLASGKSRVTDPMVNQYFAEMGAMVIESGKRLDHVNEPGYKPDSLLNIYDRFDIYTNHDVGPNAFVAGDDYAEINTALIVLTESPEELVMVLGHEFGHLRNSHLVQHYTNVQYALISGAIAQELARRDTKGQPPDSRKLAGEEAAAAMYAIFLPQTPEKEHESDATGVQVMADLGLDLHYADDLFVRMRGLYGEGGGSHPKFSDRIAHINAQVAMLEQGGYKPTKTLDRQAFLTMRDRVRQLVKEGVESKQIVYFAQEQAEAAKQKQSVVQLLGCGPLYADPAKATEIFYKAAGVR